MYSWDDTEGGSIDVHGLLHERKKLFEKKYSINENLQGEESVKKDKLLRVPSKELRQKGRHKTVWVYSTSVSVNTACYARGKAEFLSTRLS